MMKYHIFILTLIFSFLFVSCAPYPPDRYNTQAGAVTGAGMGALVGQAIGGNTHSTLVGLAAGTIIGILVGNAMDQNYQAARDAALYNKTILYYDKNGQAVEAIPEGSADATCRNVRKRVWKNGKMIDDTVEEICSTPPPVVNYYAPPPPPVVRYYAPPPPPAYNYGWWGWPFVPYFSFYFGRSYHDGGYYYPHHYGYRPYAYHHGRRHR